MTVYTLPMDWTRDVLDAMCQWMEANGIDAKTVPMRAEIEVTTGETDEGLFCFVINYYERVDLMWVGRTVPLVSPMPDGLAAQCRLPRTLCPHCGCDINALPEAVAR